MPQLVLFGISRYNRFCNFCVALFRLDLCCKDCSHNILGLLPIFNFHISYRIAAFFIVRDVNFLGHLLILFTHTFWSLHLRLYDLDLSTYCFFRACNELYYTLTWMHSIILMELLLLGHVDSLWYGDMFNT